jgi:hypothetical protein
MSALTDPSPTIYVILGTVVIILAALWARNRTRSNLIQLAIGAAFLLAVVICDALVESPREQAVRIMKEMARATQERRMDDAFRHISDSFNYNNAISKTALRERARWAEAQPGFAGVGVSTFERADAKRIDDKTVQIGFEVFALNAPVGEGRFYCLGTFKQETDGEYRLTGLEFHKANEGAAGQVVFPPHLER